MSCAVGPGPFAAGACSPGAISARRSCTTLRQGASAGAVNAVMLADGLAQYLVWKRWKRWLMVVPFKGSLPTAVPSDPLIYRFYELVNVYGTTFKELIHEEFGDGIMSAIDFRMDLQREPNTAGDRVSITMSGKFLPYKTY